MLGLLRNGSSFGEFRQSHRLHGTSGCVGKRAAQPLCSVAGLVAMVEVEQLVESRVIRLDLSLGGPAEEAVALGEVDGMEEHVQLRKSVAARLRLPVLMNIRHHAAPGINFLRRPVFGMKQRMVQLFHPACEDGVRCLRGIGHGE